jgi:hypothetical protein
MLANTMPTADHIHVSLPKNTWCGMGIMWDAAGIAIELALHHPLTYTTFGEPTHAHTPC